MESNRQIISIPVYQLRWKILNKVAFVLIPVSIKCDILLSIYPCFKKIQTPHQILYLFKKKPTFPLKKSNMLNTVSVRGK